MSSSGSSKSSLTRVCASRPASFHGELGPDGPFARVKREFWNRDTRKKERERIEQQLLTFDRRIANVDLQPQDSTTEGDERRQEKKLKRARGKYEEKGAASDSLASGKRIYTSYKSDRDFA